MPKAELESKNPQDQSRDSERNAGIGQLFHEEHLRGVIKGGIVMPDEPTFTQFKNGIQTDSGERLVFEKDVTTHRIKRGNDLDIDAGLF
jgi:hypothetical protein